MYHCTLYACLALGYIKKLGRRYLNAKKNTVPEICVRLLYSHEKVNEVTAAECLETLHMYLSLFIKEIVSELYLRIILNNNFSKSAGFYVIALTYSAP